MWKQTITFNRIIIQTVCLIILTSEIVNGQLAAWPASSYSPAFENFVLRASSPVAAVPSGIGAQAPAIPIPKANVLLNDQVLPAFGGIKPAFANVAFGYPNNGLLYSSAFVPPPYGRR